MSWLVDNRLRKQLQRFEYLHTSTMGMSNLVHKIDYLLQTYDVPSGRSGRSTSRSEGDTSASCPPAVLFLSRRDVFSEHNSISSLTSSYCNGGSILHILYFTYIPAMIADSLNSPDSLSHPGTINHLWCYIIIAYSCIYIAEFFVRFFPKIFCLYQPSIGTNIKSAFCLNNTKFIFWVAPNDGYLSV